MQEERGFFAALFDVSFTSFVTTRIIKVLYIITLVVIGLGALAFVIAAFAQSAAGGLITLVIVAPLVSLLYVIYTRVMELNAEQVALMRQAQGISAPQPPPTAPPAV